MTAMRPDPDSDQAGAGSEYGDDTGFAAEATRTSSPETTQADTAQDDAAQDDTAQDDTPTTGDDEGPGEGGD